MMLLRSLSTPVVVLTSCHVIAVLVDGAFAPFEENH